LKQHKTLPPPPNLADFAERKEKEHFEQEKSAGSIPEGLQRFRQNLQAIVSLAKKLAHPWMGDALAPHIALIVWAALAAAGFSGLCQLVIPVHAGNISAWILGAIATAFAVIDWSESRVNFTIARGRKGEIWQAFLDTIYWARALGVVFVALSLWVLAGAVWPLGWEAEHFSDVRHHLMVFGQTYWCVPVFAALGCLLGTWFDGAPQPRHKQAWLASITGPLLCGVGIILIALIAFAARQIFAPFVDGPPPANTAASSAMTLAGLLVFLQIAIFHSLDAMNWCGESTAKANLGSSLRLQFCWTPRMVKSFLESWRNRLVCQWLPADNDAVAGPAAQRLRSVLRQALWRDILGFIPVYGCTLGFGLWFAAQQLGWEISAYQFKGLPVWLWAVLIMVVADYLEDICHLHYLRCHEKGGDPFLTETLFATLMSVIKLGLFFTAAAVVLCAVLNGTWKVLHFGGTAGWRGAMAMLITGGCLSALVLTLIAILCYRLFAKAHKISR
jgi:hypothetical protein